MVLRVILSIIAGLVTAFVFVLVGNVLVPFTQVGSINIGQVLINVSALAGIVAAIWWYFGHANRNPVV